MTSDQRRCRWQGFVNARSLAGIHTLSGPIAPGRLFRSDEPDAPPDVVRKVLDSAGITTVVDLRSETETRRRPAVHCELPGYLIAPLVDPRTDHLRDPSAEHGLADLYRGSIARNGRTITAATRAIINAPDGAVLVHCAAGKDRTGILIAIILDALGASIEDIVDDYIATEPNLAPYFAEELASIDDPVARARVATRQHSTADTMLKLLRDLHTTYGGGASYLRGLGLTGDELQRLGQRLTS